MGMYTQLQLDIQIKPGSAQTVENFLYYSKTFGNNPTSYYFNDDGRIYLETNYKATAGMPIITLHVNVSVKNYEGEIEELIRFLSPHVDVTESIPNMVGYMRYETNRLPHLIYSTTEGLKLVEVFD